MNSLLPTAAGEFILSPTSVLLSGERTLVVWREVHFRKWRGGAVGSAALLFLLLSFPQKRQPLRILNTPEVQKPLEKVWPQRQERLRERPTDRGRRPGAMLSPETLAPGSQILVLRTPVPIHGLSTPVFLFLPHSSLFCNPASFLASPFPGAGSYGVKPKCIQAMPIPSSTRHRSLQEPAGTGGIRTPAFRFLRVQNPAVIQRQERESNA